MLLYIPATLCSRAALTALRPWTMLPRPCHDLPCLAFLPSQFWHGAFGKDTFDILLKSCSVLGVCNLLQSFAIFCLWMPLDGFWSAPLPCCPMLSIAMYSHQTTWNVHQSGRLQVDSWVAASEIRIRFMMVQIWCRQSGAWTRSLDITIFPWYRMILDDIGWYRMILGCVSNLDNMQRGKSCRDQGSAKTTLAVKRISAGHPRHWWHQPQMMLFPVERCRQAPQRDVFQMLRAKSHEISKSARHYQDSSLSSHYIRSPPVVIFHAFSQLACLHSEAHNLQRPSACLETLQSSVSRLNTFQNVLPADGCEICEMTWLDTVQYGLIMLDPCLV